MDARQAAEVLRGSLKNPEKAITLADAATASGLALRDAEQGLKWLLHEYRGHLRVTDDGDLLYLFPTAFRKPWETKEGIARALSAIGRVAVGAGRFVVRAWLLIVLLAYVAIFLAILVAMMFGSRSNNQSSRGRGGGGALVGVLFRALADAMFWTFHPFSPIGVYSTSYGGYGYAGGQRLARARSREPKDETPFYEKVNRFVFGPPAPKEDPRADERRILAEIRVKKGRIGLSDVMRVTGMPREEADPMMARLMLDYEGEVEVSESGAIFYTFKDLRKTTAEAVPAPPSAPARTALQKLPPLTGNDAGANLAVFALNAFNALMAWFAISQNLTVDKTIALFSGIPLAKLPYDGVPIVLGVVPLVFSIALFVVPLARAAVRPLRAHRVARQNARVSVLREILSAVKKKEHGISHDALARAWQEASGRPADEKELTREVVRLGGDVDMDAAEKGAEGVRYRFADLEAEEEALEAERAAADEGEAKVGKVIFASDR